MKLQKNFYQNLTSLIRVGKENDGGYCVPKSQLLMASVVKFWLNDDWSFEKIL